MVATTQIEAKLAFEPPKTPEFGSSGGSGSVARESTKPDFTRDSASNPAPAPVSGGNEAFSIDLSASAQQVAANNSGSNSSAQQPSTGSSALQSTVEASATAEIGTNAGASASPANDTNQVASFENERSGNDTSNQTEAGRTLGQVIDTFA